MAPAGAEPRSGEALSGLARPLGGYQVKPRYPESARRAGVKALRRCACGYWKTAGWARCSSSNRRDFAISILAAMEAVKKWLFEPATPGQRFGIRLGHAAGEIRTALGIRWQKGE